MVAMDDGHVYTVRKKLGKLLVEVLTGRIIRERLRGDSCPCCNVAGQRECAEHFLLECEAWGEQRQKFLAELLADLSAAQRFIQSPLEGDEARAGFDSRVRTAQFNALLGGTGAVEVDTWCTTGGRDTGRVQDWWYATTVRGYQWALAPTPVAGPPVGGAADEAGGGGGTQPGCVCRRISWWRVLSRRRGRPGENYCGRGVRHRMPMSVRTASGRTMRIARTPLLARRMTSRWSRRSTTSCLWCTARGSE